jgi:hypothetical protein
MIPNIQELCDCCGGAENQPILQLFDDKCFRVVDKLETHGEFCLRDFAFPVDGYSCIGLNVDAGSGETVLFDNEITNPANDLVSEKLYARGIILKVTYPLKDNDGEEIPLVDKNATLSIQNASALEETQYPVHSLFMIFTNPKSNKSSDLINKIKITNPNSNYKIRVSALVLYGAAI